VLVNGVGKGSFIYKIKMMMKILTEEGVGFCYKVIGVRFLKGSISL